MGYFGHCRSCNVFPTVNVNGTLRHLLLTPVQLEEYQLQLQHVLTRYLQRLQWLLSGLSASTYWTASHVKSKLCIAIHKRLTTTGTHVPYGITQCYMPPGRGDIPALAPAEAGTQFSDPGGMQSWWLVRDALPASRRSPIQALAGPDLLRLFWRSDH